MLYYTVIKEGLTFPMLASKPLARAITVQFMENLCTWMNNNPHKALIINGIVLQYGVVPKNLVDQVLQEDD